MSNSFAYKAHPSTLVLFDIDGTLTPARKQISSEMLETLVKLRKEVVVGFVGGSDLAKQKEQIGDNVCIMKLLEKQLYLKCPFKRRIGYLSEAKIELFKVPLWLKFYIHN